MYKGRITSEQRLVFGPGETKGKKPEPQPGATVGSLWLHGPLLHLGTEHYSYNVSSGEVDGILLWQKEGIWKTWQN